MENNNESVVISLADLFGIFLHRLWILILVPVLVVAGMFVYNEQTFVPQYKSTATLYILKQQDSSNSVAYSTQDFTLALNVVKDCTYFLKSNLVLDKVIDNLNLEVSAKALAAAISTNNPADTRILEVTVVADTPERAKSIVDEVCRIGAKNIVKTMGFNQVSVYENGILNVHPCNKTGLTTYMLAGIVAFVLVYAIFLLIYIMDDKIKSEEDVVKYLELSVLGEIPNTEETKRAKNKYYSRYAPNDKKTKK